VAYFLLDDAAVRRLAEGSKSNTDDLTLLEYHAPRTLLDGNSISADKELIDELRNGPLPENLDPREAQRALEAGAITSLDLNDLAGARKYLGALELQPDSAARYIVRGRLDLVQGDLPEAKSSFEAGLRLDPDSLDAMHWLAVAEHETGNDISAQARLNEMLKRNPGFMPALNDRMQFAIDRKDYRAALLAQLMRIAVMGDPPAYEYCRLGAMWVKQSNLSEAESALLKGLVKDPYSYSCHVELGEVYALSGRLAQARQNLEWVVRFFPAAEATTYKALAGISSALGDFKSARSTVRKGRRLFPDDLDLKNAESIAPLAGVRARR
jgi:tetratricopeptide (TPR) repeat protein